MSASTNVHTGYLDNYYGFAGAGQGFGFESAQHAEVSQTFDSAGGMTVATAEQASNQLGVATTSTKISDGGIGGYSFGLGFFESLPVLADGTGVVAGHTFYGADGKEIKLDSSASSPDGSKWATETKTDGTYDYPAEIFGYISLACLQFNLFSSSGLGGGAAALFRRFVRRYNQNGSIWI